MPAQSLKPRAEKRNARMDPVRFEAMLRAHEAFIAGKGGARALPRYVDLKGLRCDRRLMVDIDFTGSDLTGSRFVGADLSRASLYCANLTRCNFNDAKLVRADLRGAVFTGAKLEAANLDEADLRAAVLCVVDEEKGFTLMGALASLVGARLNGADLSDANAFGVDFSSASLRGARMRNANFKNACFDGANMEGADLSGARLVGARFHNAIMTGIDIARLDLPADAFAGCLLDPTPAARARLDDIRRELDESDRWVESHGDQGHPAMLDGLDLRPAADRFAGRLLAGMTARYSIGVGVSFAAAQLQGAIFDGADLRGADFRRADLRGASFRGANLAHAAFLGTDLSALGASGPARFDDANLEGTGLAPRVLKPDVLEI